MYARKAFGVHSVRVMVVFWLLLAVIYRISVSPPQ